MPKDKIPQGILNHAHTNEGQKKNKRGARASMVKTSTWLSETDCCVDSSDCE